MADLVSGGKAGKTLADAGVRFKEAREIAEGWHSDVTKAQKAEFQNAEGVTGKAAVALSNPSLIAMAVGESLGAMGAGGAIGRGAMAATRLGQMGAKGAAIAGGAGEGVVGAGSAAEQIRQESSDGELSGKQAALAAATGVVTGGLGVLGGKVANRLGIGDADTMMAQGMKGVDKQIADEAVSAAINPLTVQQAKSLPRKVIEGAISEGLLEELPQSVSEQVLQNLALDKPWSEGVDDAIVMGMLSGGAMGAGAAGFRGFKDKQLNDATAKAVTDNAAAAGTQGAAVSDGGVLPAAWTTAPGAASLDAGEPATAVASPANAPNLDYETLPGAAPEAAGNEIDFTRDFTAPNWSTEELYKARAQGEATKQDAYKSQVQAYSAYTSAQAERARVAIAQAQAKIAAKGMEWEGWRARLSAEVAKMDAAAKQSAILVDGYRVGAHAIETKAASFMRRWEADIKQYEAGSNISLQTAKLNADVAIQTNNARLEAAKIGLTTSAQRVASAWSMVSASAGISGSSNWSYSGSLE